MPQEALVKSVGENGNSTYTLKGIYHLNYEM